MVETRASSHRTERDELVPIQRRGDGRSIPQGLTAGRIAHGRIQALEPGLGRVLQNAVLRRRDSYLGQRYDLRLNATDPRAGIGGDVPVVVVCTLGEDLAISERCQDSRRGALGGAVAMSGKHVGAEDGFCSGRGCGQGNGQKDKLIVHYAGDLKYYFPRN